MQLSIIFFLGLIAKEIFLALQNENQELLVKNNTLAKENNFLETDILSKQKNDVHAEKFAREELNLIYEDEDFLRFKEVKPNEPQAITSQLLFLPQETVVVLVVQFPSNF